MTTTQSAAPAGAVGGVLDDEAPAPARRRRGAGYGHRFIPLVALGLDIMVLTVALGLSSVARNAISPLAGDDLGARLTIVAPLLALGWIVSIASLGGYEERVFGAGSEEFRRIVNSSFLLVAVVGAGCYVAQYPLSRGFFLLSIAIAPVLLLVGRMALRLLVQSARRRGVLAHRVMVVGTTPNMLEVRSVLERESWLGYRVVGSLAPDQIPRPAGHRGPLKGQAARVAAMARALNADVVFLAGGAFDSSTDSRRLAWELEHEDISVVIAPSVSDVSSERVSVRPVGGLPLIHLEKPRSQDAVRRAKRTFDILGSLSLITLFTPVLLFAAARVWAHDRGPVLFRQTRVGRDGSTFLCWKFRTMVTNAEDLLAQLHAQVGYEGGLFKLEDDPRVTAPGKWLRRFSLDELPQLFNVLAGHMSLVGPRPPLKHEVAQYDDDMARRLRVRPGMTGLWQVSGRSDLSWSEAIRLDLYYVDNWSMVQDLTILARTFRAVLGSRGAY